MLMLAVTPPPAPVGEDGEEGDGEATSTPPAAAEEVVRVGVKVESVLTYRFVAACSWVFVLS